jgi:hypothetical protein
MQRFQFLHRSLAYLISLPRASFNSHRDDDDEPEHSPAAAEGDSNAMDQDVKPQFDAEGNPTALSDAAAATSPERKKKGSPLDLEIFSDDVLRELKKDVLIGDVANVEGPSFLPSSTFSFPLRLTVPVPTPILTLPSFQP